MAILNWGSSVGNRTIDTSGVFLIPETEAQRLARTGVELPANLVGKNDYGLGFEFTIDPESGDGTFLLDSNGLKRSSGSVSYSAPVTERDYLEAVGYPPGVLSSGVHINALDLTTIRMGDGNDVFALAGDGITQALSAEVNKEASAGYIFQSNIFAGAGDDFVSVLMPWQSVFKGGSNTIYYDAVFGTDPGGGIPVTLDDDLTLEEVAYGDLIVLKGSRFDWDIEFKDGDGDGQVTLASILDERDYIAVSNNNRIYGFERILFGDILFDLILARQQDSSAVFGQPDYYLNGAENQAPELNSSIIQGSGLWEAFRFNRTKLEGITGIATQPIQVYTGDAADTPFLVGALQFASLFTEGGADIVEIGSVDQATVDLGGGSDQLKVNRVFSRSNALGGEGDDNIILDTVANSRVSGGLGRDIIEVRTSATESAFDGGGHAGDTLLLPGIFSSYNLRSSTTDGVVTFTDSFGNSFTGFESIQFSDISLDALQTLSLTGLAQAVPEGDTAEYAIALRGTALSSGDSVAFSIQLGNGTAQFSSDLAELLPTALQASAGIVLRNVSVDGASGLIRAVASARRSIPAADPIAMLRLPVLADLQAEPDETFTVTLADFVQSQTVFTTITNVPPVTIRLNGPTSVAEGQTASYAVVLDGVGLAAGRSVTFSLDSASGTATEGVDFDALVPSSLLKADGIQLSNISTAADGTVTVMATNASGVALAAGATLLTAELPITTDSNVEGNESFGVTLTSSTAVVSGGLVTTTINDQVSTPTITLSGETSIAEGESAAYAVSLEASGLPAGQSLTFTLDSASGTATEGLDFTALAAADLKPAAGVSLDAVATDPVSKAITLTTTNISGASLPAGSQLVSFAITTQQDGIVEGREQLKLLLSSRDASVLNDSLETTIVDSDRAAIRLDGASSVLEGARTSPYRISLSGVGLGAGQSIPLTLDLRSGSALKGTDFRALKPADLTAAEGVRLSGINVAGNGVLRLQARATSGVDLAANAQLLSFSIASLQDQIAEGDESFKVVLASSTAAATDAVVETTIRDNDPLSIELSGPATLAEGSRSQPYALSLGSGGIDVDQSLQLRLGLFSGSAVVGDDLAPLRFNDLSLAKGVAIASRKTLADGSLSFRLVNSGASVLAPGSRLFSFVVEPFADRIVEGVEAFQIQASLQGQGALTRRLQSRITDGDRATLALSGPASVREGSRSNPFRVELGGAGLAPGQRLQVSLGLAGQGGARVDADFNPLAAADMQLAAGLSIAESRQQASGGLVLQLVNDGSRVVPTGAALVRFGIETASDELIETGESIQVSLRSASATVSPSQRQLVMAILDTSKPVVEPPPGGGGDGDGSDGGGEPVVPPPGKEINGTSGPDVLTGSALNNVIYGGKGSDLMTGGGGANVFRFRLRDGLNQGDAITDYRPGSDTIRLEDVPKNSLAAAAFGGKSRLTSANLKSAFKVVDTLDGSDRSSAVFVYARLTGELAYNENGRDAGFGRRGGVIASLPVLLPFDARGIQLVYAA
jgi:hypothetical protein